MMREILFRGKCKDTGKWYEGYYVHLHKTTYCFKEDYDRNPDNDMHQIIFEEMMDWGLPNRHFRVDVIPETVGQYTGLTDKNGKKIFEGDIVNVNTKPNSLEHGYRSNHLVVRFDEYHRFVASGRLEYPLCNHYEWEVIGNIHDKPELLKGGEK